MQAITKTVLEILGSHCNQLFTD